MDDLISRQAAIDALDVGAEFLRRVLDDTDIVGVERTKYEWGLGLIESYIYDIKELPSAQQWIPCSERMPQTNVSILYCTTTGTVGEGRYEGYNGFHEVWKMYAICGTHWDDEVIAWMPLPEPYKT